MLPEQGKRSQEILMMPSNYYKNTLTGNIWERNVVERLFLAEAKFQTMLNLCIEVINNLKIE
jgi:hypothetical protein